MVFCIAILILALLIGHFRQVGNFGVETDFYGAYAKQAENIIAGRPYTYQHNPPGYSLLLAATSFLTGDFFVAGKIISAFATALLGWITYLLLKALFGSRIALASTTLTLIALVPWSFLVATDMVAALLIMLSLWCLLRRPDPTFKACFLTGILAGLAYLVRYQAIFVIVGIAFSLVSIGPQHEKLRRRFLMAGIFLWGALLITSPWLVINWQRNGSPFASTAYLQIAAHFYHPAGQVWAFREAFDFDSLLDVVLHDPLVLLTKYVRAVLHGNIIGLTTKTLKFPAYLLAGAGFLLLLRDLCRRRLTLLVVFLLGYLLLGLVAFWMRYYFFLFPILFLLIAYFLFDKYVFTKLGHDPFFRMPVSWLLLIIIGGYQGLYAYRATSDIITSEPRYLFEIADLLRNRSSSNDIIFALKPHYQYLTGLKSAFPVAQNPREYLETADEYLEKAQKIGARYIIYSDYEAKIWPGLKSLADPKALPHNFKLIYHHKPTNTLIYEVATAFP